MDDPSLTELIEPATAEHARRAGEMLEKWLGSIEDHPVLPPIGSAELGRLFGGTLGDDGVGLNQALDEVETNVLPNSHATQSPMYFGLLNCTPLPAAPIADLLVSTLNNNGGAKHQGPAAWAAEQEVIRAFARLIDVDGAYSGMILPGGTFANLQGLVVARASAAQPTRGRQRVYTCETSHFSVARSAAVAGFAPEDLVNIPYTGRGAIDPQALIEAIERDRRDLMAPLAVVATVGTTGTGAIDPLEEIADICHDHDVWLHVDACYGAGGLLLDELRPRLRGLERADSIAIDPHKWFFCPLTASLFLLRRPGADLAAFDRDVSYIPRSPAEQSGDSQGQAADAWRRGLPTSRRATGLSVWLTLRAHGFAPVREAVRRNIRLSRVLEELLHDRDFAVMPDGELSVVCARYEPSGQNSEEADALQTRIAQDVCASGHAWFGTVRHAGRVWLSFRSTNLHTQERHVHQLADLVHGAALRQLESARIT